MGVAAAFVLVAAGLVALAAGAGGWGSVLVWPAVAFAGVAAAYAGAGPAVFGKRPDGSLRPLNLVVLLPFLLFAWAVWHLVRLADRRPAWAEVTPGVFAGRRPLARELPPEVGMVVDLAAEFPAARGVRRAAGRYLSLPTLDAGVPDPAGFRAAVAEAAGFPGPVLVHCAQGHGRTGLFTAAVVMARGLAADPAEAVALVRAARPGVRLNRCQRRFLARWRATATSSCAV